MKALLYIYLLVILTGFSGKLQSEAEEYTLKAAFIYNFTKYIEWDATSQEEEFIIGVLGDSPINRPLAEIARTKSVNGKRIVLTKFSSPDKITFCHVLFISRNASFPLNEIVEKSSKGTLLVSEKAGSAIRGAAVNFIIVNNNLKFEVNTKTINSAGLKASSQLLKLAIIVDKD